RFRNGSNAAPSYVMGCVGGACGGAGTVRSERVLSHTVPSPFFTGPLRSPARLQNTFAHECCLDEVAAHVQADPVAYRLRHLRDRRLIEVVQAVAKAAAWEAYEGDNGYAAMVAEVEVDQATGRLHVLRCVAALGNAIFDATGARLRQVPFTPERVKAALEARPA